MYIFTVTVTNAAGGSSSVLPDIRGKLLASVAHAQRGIPSNAAASSSSVFPNFRRVRLLTFGG